MSNTKRAGENAESKPINLRLPHAVDEELSALARSLPIVSKHRLAVEAMRLGLATIAADTSVLLRVTSTPSTPTPRAPAAPAAPAPSRHVASPAVPVEAPAVDPRQLPLLAADAPPAKPKRARSAAPAVVDVEGAQRRAAEVAERLRSLRDAEVTNGVPARSRQWTIRPIADRAGVSGDPVAKLFRGERISPAMVDKIAAILPPE